ncbi:FAD-dependent oxidoreductase [[Pseudomonas] carboxydohydrogena]|uniref:FAD-dependent oxidoreductase n=1 Tax=Afipia carboxydohydrogena TaxID=290 RepID=A0ABY8BJV8_AFICR|nr:FAD-dependent oxidoreductase [[Pseudomonas] carboxydohydrogena]WEF50288.1 FAD-dependent oxidoreductase [[Pseudomonas] carboxydohydrogena]
MDEVSRSVETIHVQCCVVGGGPAGMMLGYLLGRAGIKTVVLEKHADFFRDFRGDTVHPSTMTVMQELGVLQDFLKVPHDEVSKLNALFGTASIRLADLTRLDTPCPFIAFMPQWDFLNFIDSQGRRFPQLEVRKKAEAVELVRDADSVTGVVAKTEQGPLRISADLTVACDGRHSLMRAQAGMEVRDIGAPMDVLWFRVSKPANAGESVFARIQSGQMMVMLDRNDYWQCAYVIAKNGYEKVKEAGLDNFRSNIVRLAPLTREHMADVKSWDDVKLLSVQIDRLAKWAKPGFLCIGDAAHAMSPVGGVGVNLAIQDAVAAANLLYDKFGGGGPSLDDLNRVQARREFPVRATQAIQVFVQNRLINRAITDRQFSPPLVMRLVGSSPWLQGLTARAIGIGIRPEHVHTPEAKRTG